MPDQSAGSEDSPERPVLTVTQVCALADAIGPRYHALVLLATCASLRWAELAALRPQDIDLDACTVRVTRQISYQRGGGHSFVPPQSRAGRRVVSYPGLIAPDLSEHIGAIGLDAALIFTSPEGSPLHHTNLKGEHGCPRLRLSAWTAHLHDLRHTGNQFSAEAARTSAN